MRRPEPSGTSGSKPNPTFEDSFWRRSLPYMYTDKMEFGPFIRTFSTDESVILSPGSRDWSNTRPPTMTLKFNTSHRVLPPDVQM